MKDNRVKMMGKLGASLEGAVEEGFITMEELRDINGVLLRHAKRILSGDWEPTTRAKVLVMAALWIWRTGQHTAEGRDLAEKVADVAADYDDRVHRLGEAIFEGDEITIQNFAIMMDIVL